MRRIGQRSWRMPRQSVVSRLTRHGGNANASLIHPPALLESAAALSSSAATPRRVPSPPKTPQISLSFTPDTKTAFLGLLTERLCSPTQPLPLRNVYDALANRSRVVEEFHFVNSHRRIAHQQLALRFLRRYNVLLHGLLFFCENTQTWNTTAEFERLALFGESILACEVRSRLLKLFPDIPYSVLVQSLPLMTGEAGLSAAFDLYEMSTIVGERPKDKRGRRQLTSEQKCHMLCAVVGEMYWFVARTKPTDRTHNNAIFPPSDVLILHVLCSHLLECMPAELIYRLLEPLMGEVKQVWVNAPMSLPSQLRLTPRTIGALSLNTVPLPAPTAAAVVERCAEAQAARRPLTSAADTFFVKSTMRPLCNHHNFDGPHYQIADTDEVMEKCVLMPEKQSQPSSEKSVGMPEAVRVARAMELAKLALVP